MPSADFEATQEKVEQLINNGGITLFTTRTCPFCVKAKAALDAAKLKYDFYELDILEDGTEMRKTLAVMTKRTSVPSIWVGGEYIGGCNDGPGLLPLMKSGKLQDMIDSLPVRRSARLRSKHTGV